MGGSLNGLKVPDRSCGITGPITAMSMVDHGADVTKIEPPGGDPFRDQLACKAWQQGKRNAVPDLKSGSDPAPFLNLMRDADIPGGRLRLPAFRTPQN